MAVDLYTVFERDGDQVGISEFGEQRTLTHIRGGSIALTKLIQLHELGPYIAALNRSGFTQTLNGAFFNENAPIFSARHPDFFLSNDYIVFVQAPDNVQEAVSRIEAIGLKGVRGDQRMRFNDWLRSLDMSCTYLVATSHSPASVLALCEFAFEKSLCIYSSLPSHPGVAPSADKEAWVQWLASKFDAAEIASIHAALWPQRPITQPAVDTGTGVSYLFDCFL